MKNWDKKIRRRGASVIVGFLLGILALPGKALADTALNQAVVEAIRNQVQLLLQDESARSAQVSDVLAPGDGLATADDSLAELRFNDGSLGRLGEQVIFWFTPGTRDFSLSNGTVLLLVPPGQGNTTIRTPNASAGIQGSALFVRYISDTDTTIVGALTDSGIQIINEDGTERQTLAAGQIAVAVGDRIERIYNFDLRTFYETSDLVRDLGPALPSTDPAIEAVQTEMQDALDRQVPLTDDQVVENPEFIRLPERSGFPDIVPDPALSSNSADDRNPPFDSNPDAQLTPSTLRDNSEVRSPRPDPDNGRPPRDPELPQEPPQEPIPPDNPMGQNPDRNPPGQNPGQDPGSDPGDDPSNEPDNNPGQDPDRDPPGQDPGNDPSNEPDNNPGQNPDRDPPGQDPGNDPSNEPDNNSGQNPDRDPPGQDPGNDPSNEPDDDRPGRGPVDVPPGQDPDRDTPGRDPGDPPPGQDPDRDPPGRGPEDDAGLGIDIDIDLGDIDDDGNNDAGVGLDLDLDNLDDTDLDIDLPFNRNQERRNRGRDR